MGKFKERQIGEEILVEFEYFESETEVHLIPKEDTLTHKPKKDCICIPQRDETIEGMKDEEELGKIIYLHYDAQMREYH